MAEVYEYTIEELLEEAKNDPSWEPDPERREALVRQLSTTLQNA